MEKVKQVLSPGKKTDDEMMYGSGNNTTHNSGVTGQGSHFDHTGNARLNDTTTASQPVHGQPFTSQAGTGLTGGSTNAGPHNSNAANKMDPRVDSDLDGRSGMGNTHSAAGQSGYNTGITGGNHSFQNTSGLPEGSVGPHSSRVANAADPRVDSDLDRNRNTHGSGLTGAGYNSSGLPEGSVGPHSSRVANAADPRVDSDLDRNRNTHGSGLTGAGYNSSGLPEGSVGPHSSRVANAADPRVDSDLDRNRNTHGAGVTGTGYNSGLPEGSVGPHSSRVANAADPRVDSDLDRKHKNTGSGLTGAGQGIGGHQTDAGPVHNSKVLNKLDPRVDEKRVQNTSGTQQNMPGSFPSGNQNEAVHNPYTSHEVDPRIGGSTQQSSTTHTTSGGLNNQHQTDSNLVGQKGLNAARTEDYSQTGHSHHGRDAAAVGGAGLAGAAAAHHAGGRHTDAENRHLNATGTGATENPINPTQGGSIVDDRRASRRGSAVNLPPPQGAVAAGLMTDFDHHQKGVAPGGETASGSVSMESGHGSTNAGPHNSNVANKLDPRVDSDRDGRAAMGNTHGTHGTTSSGLTSNSSSTHHNTSGLPEGSVGPHSSRAANTADPRVDSDLDGRGNHQDTRHTHDSQGGLLSKVKSALTGGAAGGAAAHHTTHGSQYGNRTQGYSEAGEIPVSQSEYARGNTTSSGLTGSNYGSTNAGPHDSNAANKLDPRVDSDRDGRAGMGNSHTTHTTGSGLTGSNYGSTNAGPHDSNAANKLDPRVDSDRDGRAGMGNSHTTHTTGSGLTGSNYGSTNAGPHDSNAANKLDPRVDSDRDGRSGMGGTSGVGSANQKPIPLEGVELPRGNQYGQDVKDPRYGLPMSAAGVTAAEAEQIRYGHNDGGLQAQQAAHDTDPSAHGTTQKKSHGLLGFLHRDKNKKYTKDEEAEFDRQEREHNSRHGLTKAGGGVAGAGVAGSTYENEKNKPLPPDPTQAQTGTGYNQGQEMNLADRTRHTGDTSSAPTYSVGMADTRRNPIQEQNTMGGEIPVQQSEYARNTKTSSNYGPHGTVGNKLDPRVDSDRDGRSGLGGSSAYPSGAGDGRDYPVGGNTTEIGSGEKLASKVTQRDDGHNVLHKKGHVIHPGATEGQSGYAGDVLGAQGSRSTGGNY